MIDTLGMSRPEPGRTMQSLMNEWFLPLISTHHSLINSAIKKKIDQKIFRIYKNVLYPVIPIGENFTLTENKAIELSSSAIISIWILFNIANKSKNKQSFIDAESWFFNNSILNTQGFSTINEWGIDDNLNELEMFHYDDGFIEAFPYILESFEMKDKIYDIVNNNIKQYQIIKRKSGIFYTPSDVIKYMLNEIIKWWKESDGDYNFDNINCLDPACGTGVFLISLLNKLNECQNIDTHSKIDIAKNCIYGFDISPQAIQSCAFVILLECLPEILKKNLTPSVIWQVIRGNLAVIDSTTIQGRGCQLNRYQDQRKNTRDKLLFSDIGEYNRLIKTKKELSFPVITLGDIFSEVSDGFSIIVGNPPYSKVSNKSLTDIQKSAFISINSGNLYTQFIEMMWQFTKLKKSASGIIVPLSIAYHSGKPYKNLRNKIQSINGEWTFQFFDRTPDSIFGDDIKTRNSIIFFKRNNSSENSITSSTFKRWNSRNRVALFNNLK